MTDGNPASKLLDALKPHVPVTGVEYQLDGAQCVITLAIDATNEQRDVASGIAASFPTPWGNTPEVTVS